MKYLYNEYYAAITNNKAELYVLAQKDVHHIC